MSDLRFRRVVETFEFGIKTKLRRRRDVVGKSQSHSKKFDAIDVGLYCQLIVTDVLDPYLHAQQYAKIPSIRSQSWSAMYDFM